MFVAVVVGQRYDQQEDVGEDHELEESGEEEEIDIDRRRCQHHRQPLDQPGPTGQIDERQGDQHDQQQHGHGLLELDEALQVAMRGHLRRHVPQQVEAGHDQEHQDGPCHVEQDGLDRGGLRQPVFQVVETADVLEHSADDDQRNDLVLLGDLSGMRSGQGEHQEYHLVEQDHAERRVDGMERTLVDPLEERLGQVRKQPGDPNHAQVHEKADGRPRHHQPLQPAPHGRAVEGVEDVGQPAADRTQHGYLSEVSDSPGLSTPFMRPF